MKQKFIKHRTSDAIKISSIVTVHDLHFEKTYIFSGKKHNFREFVYVVKGTAVAEANGNVYRLSKGDMIFRMPNEFHAIRSEPKILRMLLS